MTRRKGPFPYRPCRPGWTDDVAVLPPDPWDWPDARALVLGTPVPGNPDREPRDPLSPDYDCGRELY